MTTRPNDHQREFAYECMAGFGRLVAKGEALGFIDFAARIQAESPQTNIDLLLQLPEARIERALDGSFALNFVPARANTTRISELASAPAGPKAKPRIVAWWMAEGLRNTSMRYAGRLISALPADAVVRFASHDRVLWHSHRRLQLPKPLAALWLIREATPEEVAQRGPVDT